MCCHWVCKHSFILTSPGSLVPIPVITAWEARIHPRVSNHANVLGTWEKTGLPVNNPHRDRRTCRHPPERLQAGNWVQYLLAETEFAKHQLHITNVTLLLGTKSSMLSSTFILFQIKFIRSTIDLNYQSRFARRATFHGCLRAREDRMIEIDMTDSSMIWTFSP